MYNLLISFLLFSIFVYFIVSTSSKTGSWDASFKDAGGLLRNVTYTGNYNKINKMVFFCVNVQFQNFTTLGTTQYQITLPFPARQTFTSRGGSLHNPTVDARYHIAGITDTILDPSKDIMKLYYSGSTTDLAWKNTTPVGWTGGSSTTTHFDISGFYEIA